MAPSVYDTLRVRLCVCVWRRLLTDDGPLRNVLDVFHEPSDDLRTWRQVRPFMNPWRPFV